MNGFLLATWLAAAPAPATPSDKIVDDAKQLVQETGEVVTRPALLGNSDLWILIPAALGTGLALAFDSPLYLWIRRWPDPNVGPYRSSYVISYFGEGTLDLALFVGLGLAGLIGGDTKLVKTFIAGAEALVATAVVSRALKIAFREERPQSNPHKLTFFSRNWWHADSFPSGHTMSVFATAAVIAEEYPDLAPIVYPIAFCVAIARVQQQVHWPSDLIIGGALGYLFGRQATSTRLGMRLLPQFSEEGAGLALTGTF